MTRTCASRDQEAFRNPETGQTPIEYWAIKSRFDLKGGV